MFNARQSAWLAAALILIAPAIGEGQALAQARPATASRLHFDLTHLRDWDAFFAHAAARRADGFFSLSARNFAEHFPAPPEQIRAAFLRAVHQNGSGADDAAGRRDGHLFEMYYEALKVRLGSAQAAADFARQDFRRLSDANLHFAFWGMPAGDATLFRAFLTPAQNTEIRRLANAEIARQRGETPATVQVSTAPPSRPATAPPITIGPPAVVARTRTLIQSWNFDAALRTAMEARADQGRNQALAEALLAIYGASRNASTLPPAQELVLSNMRVFDDALLGATGAQQASLSAMKRGYEEEQRNRAAAAGRRPDPWSAEGWRQAMRALETVPVPLSQQCVRGSREDRLGIGHCHPSNRRR